LNIEATIRQRFERMGGPFPRDEFRWLCPDQDEREDFATDLDLYLAGIAGYSSAPHRLLVRSQKELDQARDFLATAFFEQYPQYQPYRFLITSQHTPVLHEWLELAEANRKDLQELLRSQRRDTA
jgi:hypothetical protein